MAPLAPRRVCCFALFLVLVIILRYVGGLERDDVFAAVDAVGQSHIVHGVEPSQRTTPERVDLAATYTNEKLASGAEVEYIWQEAKGGGRPRAVILLAHGCSHGAVDFWPRDRVRCPRCKGLPEEVRSDGGRNLNPSEIFKGLYKLLKITGAR